MGKLSNTPPSLSLLTGFKAPTHSLPLPFLGPHRAEHNFSLSLLGPRHHAKRGASICADLAFCFGSMKSQLAEFGLYVEHLPCLGGAPTAHNLTAFHLYDVRYFPHSTSDVLGPVSLNDGKLV